MDFKREKIRNYYLRDTQVENIFITEYMVDADGDFLKVYLTGLMYADTDDMSNSLIARHLGMEEEDVLRAWNYWEKCGVIRKHYTNPGDRFHYTVEFISQKERLFSADGGAVAGEAGSLRPEMNDDVLRETYTYIEDVTGRMMESREMEAVASWMSDEGLDPELIKFAYKYCTGKRNNNRFSYISAVVREWQAAGLKDLGAVKEHLEETDQRRGQYRRIMKALGFHRSPTEDEESKIDSWLDGMKFGMDKILEACAKTSGISSPNINYVHSILTSWKNGGSKPQDGTSGSSGAPAKNAAAMVAQAYAESRRKNEELQQERVSRVYASVPRIKEIDEELRRLSIDLGKTALRGGNASGMSADALKKRITELNGERAALLTEQNLPFDYLDLQYDCRDCKDSGMLDNGQRCHCYSEKLKLYI